MNKKLLISMIAMLTSITMLTSCGDTATTTDSAVETPAVDNASGDDATGVEVALGDGEVAEFDMENIEMTEEEFAALLGIDFDAIAESYQEGELSVDFGSSSIDDFDIVYEGTTFEFSYDGDMWIESGFPIEGTEVVLVDGNPVDFEAPANIYFIPATELPSYISMNEYIQMVVDSGLGYLGVDVLSYGVDFYEGFEVGTIETIEYLNEELILELIEIGDLTQEYVDSIGGIEEMTSWPDMYQIFMIARGENGQAYTVSGAYYSNDIKHDEIVNAIDGFMQTLITK